MPCHVVATELAEPSRIAVAIAHRLSIETGAIVNAIDVVEMAAAWRPRSGATSRVDLAAYRALLLRQLEASQQRLEEQAEEAGLHVDGTSTSRDRST